MLQESWLSRRTLQRYARSISQRSSLSWITTRNRMDRTKVQRVGRTCKIRPYISSHSRGKEKIPRTMVSYLEQIRQKKGLWNFDPILERLSLWKIVYTTSQANKLKSLFLQKNTVYGIPLQTRRGGTRIGNELRRIFSLMRILFVAVGFVLQSMAIHCNRLVVDRYTSHVIFLMHIARLIVCILTAWLKTSQDSMCLLCAFIPSTCHPWCCVFERLLSLRVSLSPVSLRPLPLLFHTLPVLCPALHLQCRHRRGLKPLHARRMRSIAPWRCTILSQMWQPNGTAHLPQASVSPLPIFRSGQRAGKCWTDRAKQLLDKFLTGGGLVLRERGSGAWCDLLHSSCFWVQDVLMEAEPRAIWIQNRRPWWSCGPLRGRNVFWHCRSSSVAVGGEYCVEGVPRLGNLLVLKCLVCQPQRRVMEGFWPTFQMWDMWTKTAATVTRQSTAEQEGSGSVPSSLCGTLHRFIVVFQWMTNDFDHSRNWPQHCSFHHLGLVIPATRRQATSKPRGVERVMQWTGKAESGRWLAVTVYEFSACERATAQLMHSDFDF